ncbi:MAG: TlpA family protein disulfide reductase [Gemmataceae bacterium]|nr:TlpA family protein disulfide reductase [Gemmataceae bacterium]
MKKLLPALVLLFVAADGPTANVKTIRYEDLTSVVRNHRGKVVVVDFWADFCLPCKREYHRVVDLHRKHARDPVAVLAVALDEPAKKPGVEAFVRRQQATFANYLLEDPYQVWQSKLKVDGPPVVFVFNKQGDLVQRFADEGVNYDIIGKLVARLIAE